MEHREVTLSRPAVVVLVVVVAVVALVALLTVFAPSTDPGNRFSSVNCNFSIDGPPPSPGSMCDPNRD